MRFDILGPLRVTQDGVAVPVKGANQRATLGFLLLHPNEVVETSRLLVALWPDGVPTTARKMVQNSVSGLRKLLALSIEQEYSPLILTHRHGYLLRVDPDQVDSARFDSLVRSARAALADGQQVQASRIYRKAQELWRGPVLADLRETGTAWPELSAWESKRLSALEDMYEVELACGRHRDIVVELEKLLEVAPHRERLCSQLMVALYRCGRQVDALHAYRHTRSVLIDNFGLDPGPELRECEQAILEQRPEISSTTTGIVHSHKWNEGTKPIGKKVVMSGHWTGSSAF